MKASELRVIANKIIEDHAKKYLVDTEIRYGLVKELLLIRAKKGKLDCIPVNISTKYSYIGVKEWITKNNLHPFQVEYIRRELMDHNSLLIKKLMDDEYKVVISVANDNTHSVSKIEW